MSIGVGCIYVCIIVRIAVTVAIAFGDKLNVKEKVALSIMFKFHLKKI